MDTLPIHFQAESIREAGKFTEALKLYDRAILLYRKQDNYAKLAEVLQGRFIAFKQLFFQTQDKKYLERAQQATTAALDLIRQHGQGDEATSYFQLGELTLIKKRFSPAIKYFTQAYKMLENLPEEGRYLYHLGLATYHHGLVDQGRELITKGIETLKKAESQLEPYIYQVWLSGAYLAQAETSQGSLQTQALQRAKRIIAANPKLVLRRQQLSDLILRLKLGQTIKI